MPRIHKSSFLNFKRLLEWKLKGIERQYQTKKLLLQTFQFSCVVREFKIIKVPIVLWYKMCCRKHVKIIFVFCSKIAILPWNNGDDISPDIVFTSLLHTISEKYFHSFKWVQGWKETPSLIPTSGCYHVHTSTWHN